MATRSRPCTRCWSRSVIGSRSTLSVALTCRRRRRRGRPVRPRDHRRHRLADHPRLNRQDARGGLGGSRNAVVASRRQGLASGRSKGGSPLTGPVFSPCVSLQAGASGGSDHSRSCALAPFSYLSPDANRSEPACRAESPYSGMSQSGNPGSETASTPGAPRAMKSLHKQRSSRDGRVARTCSWAT